MTGYLHLQELLPVFLLSSLLSMHCFIAFALVSLQLVHLPNSYLYLFISGLGVFPSSISYFCQVFSSPVFHPSKYHQVLNKMNLFQTFKHGIRLSEIIHFLHINSQPIYRRMNAK